MSQKRETVFRGRLWRYLNQVPNAWFESIQQKSIAGTPDIIGCVNGFFVALELKADEFSAPSPIQKLKLSRIAEAGGLGLLVHPANMENTIRLLMSLGEKHVETDVGKDLGPKVHERNGSAEQQPETGRQDGVPSGSDLPGVPAGDAKGD